MAGRTEWPSSISLASGIDDGVRQWQTQKVIYNALNLVHSYLMSTATESCTIPIRGYSTMPHPYFGRDPYFGHFYFSRSNLSQSLQFFVYYVYYYYYST